jgi:hypothetical protein
MFSKQIPTNRSECVKQFIASTLPKSYYNKGKKYTVNSEALPVKLSRKTVVISSKPVNSTKQNINSHSNAVIYIKRKPAF